MVTDLLFLTVSNSILAFLALFRACSNSALVSWNRLLTPSSLEMKTSFKFYLQAKPWLTVGETRTILASLQTEALRIPMKTQIFTIQWWVNLILCTCILQKKKRTLNKTWNKFTIKLTSMSLFFKKNSSHGKRKSALWHPNTTKVKLDWLKLLCCGACGICFAIHYEDVCIMWPVHAMGHLSNLRVCLLHSSVPYWGLYGMMMMMTTMMKIFRKKSI